MCGTFEFRGVQWRPQKWNQQQPDKTPKHQVCRRIDHGGSTPKALRVVRHGEDAYSNDEQMFDLIHEMRTRIITSPVFGGDRFWPRSSK